MQSGFGGDFLFGGSGNDELYSGPGDDIVTGGEGADYLECNDGYDVIIDFEPHNGDIQAENCEAVLTHNPNDIQFICYDSSSASLINSTLSIDSTSVKNILSMSSDVP